MKISGIAGLCLVLMLVSVSFFDYNAAATQERSRYAVGYSDEEGSELCSL